MFLDIGLNACQSIWLPSFLTFHLPFSGRHHNDRNMMPVVLSRLTACVSSKYPEVFTFRHFFRRLNPWSFAKSIHRDHGCLRRKYILTRKGCTIHVKRKSVQIHLKSIVIFIESWVCSLCIWFSTNSSAKCNETCRQGNNLLPSFHQREVVWYFLQNKKETIVWSLVSCINISWIW